MTTGTVVTWQRNIGSKTVSKIGVIVMTDGGDRNNGPLVAEGALTVEAAQTGDYQISEVAFSDMTRVEYSVLEALKS